MRRKWSTPRANQKNGMAEEKSRPNVAAFFWVAGTMNPERERTLSRGAQIFLLILLACTVAAAETPMSASESEDDSGPAVATSAATDSDTDNPVAAVRKNQSWEFGPFANWGTGLGNRDDFKFFWAGVQGGKVLTDVVHAGIFSGQFQFGANIMPLWQAYTPPPHIATFLYPCSTGTCYFVAPDGGGTYYGVALTPVILRWNFLTHSRRVQPWFQGAGGLIYTTHKFPPDQLVPHGTPGGTSVFNFSPQGGAGVHYFVRPKRSIDVELNAVHISSASLGDRNPGVNASLQLQVGYTFWK
jgi:lipid A 3-O-deacylase